MLKDVILTQKQEFNHLIKRPYIIREQTNYALKFLNKDIIKVVLGPRRAGKSVFCAHLVKDKKAAYLNFDDESLIKIKDYNLLIKELLVVYGKTKYLFFDEIQNLDNWELLVNRLQRQGYNIILTGSNAKLLSQELATHLTGRHLPIEILPFSFKEFLKAKNAPEEENKKHLNDFLVSGGFPEIVMKNLEIKDYLSTLIDSIIFKYIVKRHKLRLPDKLYNLQTYLLDNFSSEFTYRKLARKLDFKSDVTVEKFINYLNASYLNLVLSCYSFDLKKSYLIDNGYISSRLMQFSKNHGKIMENLVFTELLKRSYKPNRTLFYYKTRNNKEIDFVLLNKLKTDSLIQVSYNISSEETREREMRALVEVGNELKCNNLNIISWDVEKIEIYKQKK